MNLKSVSPYIRVAMFSTFIAPFVINERVIFDYEIIFVLGGTAKITIDNTPYICKKNDVIFLRPGIPHKFEHIDNYEFNQPHIHFDMVYSDKSEEIPVSFKNKSNMSDYEISLIQEDILTNENIPFVFKVYESEKFQKLFFSIIEIYQKKEYNYELTYKSKMIELISLILEQFKPASNSPKEEAYNPIVSVKNYIDNNYLQIISLESLSKQFFINKFTLLRKFKNIYGKNIISYYKKKRLDYAKNVLKTTNLPIHSIGEQLNFSDIYSFSRFFKTYTSLSPTDYRKKSKK